MTRMLAMEHMNYVEALQSQFGTALTDATLQAAIASIGTAAKTLVLTFAQDGVWHINNNLTIPANVFLWVPAGVTLNVASGVTLTIQGNYMLWGAPVFSGSGTVVTPVSNQSITTERVGAQGFFASGDGACYVAGPAPASGGSGRQVLLFSNDETGGLRSGIRFLNGNQDFTHQFDIAMVQNGGMTFRRPSYTTDFIVITDVGVGISNTTAANNPSAVLHMMVDSTLKATTLWGIPCSRAVKDVLGRFEGALARVRRFPRAIRFRYNGQGQTPTDGTEQLGYLGEEVRSVEPAMITTYQGKLHPEDAETRELLIANLSPLLPMLMTAVQELATQVEALSAQVHTLTLDGVPGQAARGAPVDGVVAS